ncbi:DotI/IcmL family type IV secretion protein [Fangia hongkongensis]|uniref:DotI/IcmL family type IV secretion protein n=1 Tax=Fangia hongkongensis TaxID=270495 RepID=UPI000364CC4B|nr:DotI/IcmL family type IV secretion protein [Fangia hongkongensis]MBK2124445.1 DotI/IcmL family type IV secretion protein [Fangia hongkongensis]
MFAKIRQLRNKKKQDTGESESTSFKEVTREELARNKATYQKEYNSADIIADKSYFLFFETLTWIFIAIILVLSYVVVTLATSRPDVKFFATDANGQVTQIHNIGNDANVLSNASIQQFITTAIPTVFTFDFNNYQYVLNKELPRYFTSNAASDIREILKKEYLPNLVSQKQFLNISVESSFIIENGMRYGKKTNEWQIQVPAILSINNGRTTKNANIKLQMGITRTNTTRNNYGLQISWIKINNDRG